MWYVEYEAVLGLLLIKSVVQFATLLYFTLMLNSCEMCHDHCTIDGYTGKFRSNQIEITHLGRLNLGGIRELSSPSIMAIHINGASLQAFHPLRTLGIMHANA